MLPMSGYSWLKYNHRDYAEIGLELTTFVCICNVKLLALQTVVIVKNFSYVSCSPPIAIHDSRN